MRKQSLNKLRAVTSEIFKTNSGEPFIFTDGQLEMFLKIIDPKIKWLWMSAPTRWGKLLADNTPILTTGGWKKHGDLSKGDEVFNEKGEPVKIRQVHPKSCADIKVEFSNGEYLLVNEQHEWIVRHRRHWDKFKIKSTRWLMQNGYTNKEGERERPIYQLPLVKPMKFKEKDLPVDPYTLGIWLGDGVKTKPAITITPKDQEIINNIPYKISSKHKHKQTGVVSYEFWGTDLFGGLKELGLIISTTKRRGKKFVPDIYKRSSIEQRLDLLAGMIDSDGNVDKQINDNGYKNGRIHITNTNKRLIDDFVEIIQSFGIRTSVTKVAPKTSTSGVVGKKNVYYLGFEPKINIPTKLKRKRIVKKYPNNNHKGHIYIKSIKRVEPVRGNCITVEGGIYLAGKKLIPTHNSDVLAMSLLYLAAIKKLKVPIVAGTQEKANKIMEYVTSHISDHPVLFDKLLNADVDKVERVKLQLSKKGLRWSHGGWVYITSVDSRTISKEGEGVVGEGGDVVVLEEAGLIRHQEQFSKIVRMPEEGRGWGKLIMSGNMIEKSVFEKAYNDPLYTKVRITLEQAVEEGRYTWEALEQKKSQTTTKDWKRYYIPEFPDPTEYAYFKPKKYEQLPLELKYVGAIDLSLGEGRTEAGIKRRSKTGISVLGVEDNGQVYEIETIERVIGPDEAIRTILAMPYEFTRFGVEAIQFQKYFFNVINEKSKEMGKYIPFIGLTQKRRKEERIEGLEPRINTGQILFKGNNDLWDSMQNYPDVDWLDGLDALEMAWRLAKLVNSNVGEIQRPQEVEKKVRPAPYVPDLSKFK